jgi:hypothetical protein
MRPNRVSLYTLILLTLLCCARISAQHASVSIGKRASRIPKSCEGVIPAAIDPIDIPALVKEAYCKGAGDTLADYTYVMDSVGRSIKKLTWGSGLRFCDSHFRLENLFDVIPVSDSRRHSPEELGELIIRHY